MKVLIIEDELQIRQLLSETLKVAGIQHIDACDSAENALKILNEQDYSFSCIFLDVNLPDMSGLELLEKIKQDKRSEKIIIFMLSGDQQRNTVLNAFEHGVASYIFKPFRLDQIKECLSIVPAC